jgi:uncharacterized membrane protein
LAIIAAGYCALTLVIAPLSFGPWQIRVSECLMILALIGWDEIGGLTLGCFLANGIGIMTSLDAIGPMDMVFGTLATLIAGWLTYRFAKIRIHGWPVLSATMPIIANGVIVGLELAITMSGEMSFWAAWAVFGLQVAGGEAIVMYALGLPLSRFVTKKVLTHE